MNRKGPLILVIIVLSLSAACAKKDTEAPRVVATFPLNESQDVDPSIREISVTFNEPMMDGNWSWAYSEKHKFPQIIGQAYYTENHTKNVLPVRLESNKEYIIWINSAKHKNFRDRSGNAAVPFKFSFKTKEGQTKRKF